MPYFTPKRRTLTQRHFHIKILFVNYNSIIKSRHDLPYRTRKEQRERGLLGGGNKEPKRLSFSRNEVADGGSGPRNLTFPGRVLPQGSWSGVPTHISDGSPGVGPLSFHPPRGRRGEGDGRRGPALPSTPRPGVSARRLCAPDRRCGSSPKSLCSRGADAPHPPPRLSDASGRGGRGLGDRRSPQVPTTGPFLRASRTSAALPTPPSPAAFCFPTLRNLSFSTKLSVRDPKLSATLLPPSR